MSISATVSTRNLRRSVSATALLIALFYASEAQAKASGQQAAESSKNSDVQSANAPGTGDAENGSIVITGTRIERKGFDQPTPTTVIGATELRNGARPNIQEVLNDLPQFRASTSPSTTITNQATGTAPVDLRGLGTARTLTLLNGRRFIGDNNLNFVPLGLVKRVDVVTGGASAAYGSGAVAGVVNIILNDRFEGLSLEAQTGVSGHDDATRYSLDATFGTSFADDRGHFIAGAEYVNDHGIGPAGRTKRPQLGAGIVRIDPTSATDQRTKLVADVNYGNTALGGLITTGVLAGQVFNPDGSLRPFQGGIQVGSAPFNSNQIGGEDAISLYDTFFLTAPLKRFSSYARVSFDVGRATVWADGTYSRAVSNYPWVTDLTLTSVTASATNPFLSQSIRDQLAAAGETSFRLGRFFPDAYIINIDAVRQNYEGAIGVDGTVGQFKYSAHYSHGESTNDTHAGNSRITANFANAIDAVAGPGGTPVCAINADAITTNDDPACVPINPFGYGNVSQAAIDYTTGTQTAYTTSKLDVAAAQVQGDLISLPAGPVTAVAGGEIRYESQGARQGTAPIASEFAIPTFTSPLSGKFNVKEVFAETAVPVIDADAIKFDLNGAARYSDYSTSGGIWSWKAGATLRLFHDLLLRGTRSRDIRSPSIGELFSTQAIGFGSVVDAQSAQYGGTPGYNANPSLVKVVSGGNPDLLPEIGSTLTVGATYSPSSFPGFRASIDYYDISIDGAIFRLSGSQLTQACGAGSAPACAAITRDATGTVTEVQANSQNLARFKTSGLDFEASYVTPLSRIVGNAGGTLSLRGLATYVDKYILDSGVTSVDTAGDLGNTVSNGIPHWRANLELSYEGKIIGFDARLRYIGAGKFDHLQDVKAVNGVTSGMVNNHVAARTYVDLGAQIKLFDRITFFGSVNNVFDEAPPLITSSSAIYDVVGRYFNIGARVKF